MSAKLLPQFEYTRVQKETYVHMMLSLEGNPDAAVERPVLDLALVIDRSGSMSGEKMQDVKTASLEISKSLHPGDALTLVSYASDVSRHFTGLRMGRDGALDRARQDILGLFPAGGTALGPALFDALGRSETAGEGAPAIGALPHVILLSDGLANAGESDPGLLGQRAARGFGAGMSVSTIGVGLDYNEDLMTRLADQGGGRYHYVRDSKEIERVLSDEMAGLVQTVASEVSLASQTSNGVVLEEVYGYASDAGETERSARIGSLGAGQTREILLRYKLPSDGKLPLGEFELGTLEVEFRGAAQGGKPGKIESITLHPKIHLTRDARRSVQSENYEVSVRLAQIESARSMDDVTQAIDAGDFDRAELLVEQARLEASGAEMRASSAAAKAEYGKQVVEFEEAKEGVERAKKSESERKAFSKGYKSTAYKKRKGSKKVYKKSKKAPY